MPRLFHKVKELLLRVLRKGRKHKAPSGDDPAFNRLVGTPYSTYCTPPASTEAFSNVAAASDGPTTDNVVETPRKEVVKKRTWPHGPPGGPLTSDPVTPQKKPLRYVFPDDD